MGNKTLGALGAILILAGAAGCDFVRWKAAEYYAKARRFPEAIRAYEDVARRSLDRPRACRAHVRAGDIYAKELSRCEEARRHYESAVRGFEEQAACVEQAKAGLLSCPDYFPTDAGRTWVYGDSASKGKNMRLEWELRLSKDGKREIVGGLFAGNKKISDQNAKYAKEGWAVWEETAGGKTVILRYPYQTGQSWEGRSGGHPVEFSVEDDAARVETAAGVFTGCLKVKERDGRFPGTWKITYYAPGVGRIKTSIGGPGFENPNTELLSWKK